MAHSHEDKTVRFLIDVFFTIPIVFDTGPLPPNRALVLYWIKAPSPKPTSFTFERNLGKTANLVIERFDDSLSSNPFRSFTNLPITWTPSTIVINLKEEETRKKWLGFMFTSVQYKDFMISRSSLKMEVKAWFKLYGPPDAKINSDEPIKLLGECKEIKYQNSDKAF